MSQRNRTFIIMTSAFLLMLFGLAVYGQYYKVVDLDDYASKYHYLQKYIFYGLSGGIGAVIISFLLGYLRTRKKMILAYGFIAVALLLNLMSTQLPFIYMISGRKYIRIMYFTLKIPTVTIILLLLAFLIIQQRLSIVSKSSLLFMNGIGILFVILVAVGGDSESTFVATLLFLYELVRIKSSKLRMKVLCIIVYCAVVGGFYLSVILQNLHNISIWLNPYQDRLGKGYMKVQDIEIMKSARILGKSSYQNTYSGEIFPTILVLFGWSVFVIILGVSIFMLFQMFRKVSGRTEMLSGKLKESTAAYFLIKILFCLLVFFRLLPFFQGGHFPFLGYGSELVIDIVLLSVFINVDTSKAVKNLDGASD